MQCPFACSNVELSFGFILQSEAEELVFKAQGTTFDRLLNCHQRKRLNNFLFSLFFVFYFLSTN
jgi:hypothetical protein